MLWEQFTSTGLSTIEFKEVNGTTRTYDIENDMIDKDRSIDLEVANGRPDETRFRFYCTPAIEGGTGANVWRSCQVIRVLRSGGGYKVEYRLRMETEFLNRPLSQFIKQSIKCSRADFLIGLGDGADGTLSRSALKSAMMDQESRMDARRTCDPSTEIPIFSTKGLQTSMNVAHIHFGVTSAHHSDMSHTPMTAVTPARSETAEIRRVTSHDTMNLFSPMSGHASPSVQGDMSDDNNDLSTTVVKNDDMNAMMGNNLASGKPVPNENVMPSSRDGDRYARKNEYDPPMPYRERERVIFAINGRYKTRGKTPGEKLDSIMSVEQAKTPGVNLGHGDRIYGFGYAYQPFGTCYMGEKGCGAVRTVQESNKNKAVLHAHQKNDQCLTNLDQLMNVTLHYTRVWGRWYKEELIQCAIFLDQFVRDAITIDGLFASICIVPGYIILIASRSFVF